VLKIHARAQSCSRALEGSGFVISSQRVMTNAHVVAGTDQVAVETDRGQLPAKVVYYDPETDVAILAVPDLTAKALPFASEDGKNGDDSIVLGYPLDGPYTASPSRISERIMLRGPGHLRRADRHPRRVHGQGPRAERQTRAARWWTPAAT